MEIDAFLADSVQAAGGKLHALGIGWQVIQASAFPVRHDRIGLGLVVRTAPDEAGAHTLTLSLLDPTGEPRLFGDQPSGRGAQPVGGGDGEHAGSALHPPDADRVVKLGGGGA